MSLRVTKNTVAVYKYIVQYMKDNMFAPSIREISAATGLKSTSSVYNHLKKLEILGLISVHGEAQVRSIKLTGYKLVKDESQALPDLESMMEDENLTA